MNNPAKPSRVYSKYRVYCQNRYADSPGFGDQFIYLNNQFQSHAKIVTDEMNRRGGCFFYWVEECDPKFKFPYETIQDLKAGKQRTLSGHRQSNRRAANAARLRAEEQAVIQIPAEVHHGAAGLGDADQAAGGCRGDVEPAGAGSGDIVRPGDLGTTDSVIIFVPLL